MRTPWGASWCPAPGRAARPRRQLAPPRPTPAAPRRQALHKIASFTLPVVSLLALRSRPGSWGSAQRAQGGFEVFVIVIAAAEHPLADVAEAAVPIGRASCRERVGQYV